MVEEVYIPFLKGSQLEVCRNIFIHYNILTFKAIVPFNYFFFGISDLPDLRHYCKIEENTLLSDKVILEQKDKSLIFELPKYYYKKYEYNKTRISSRLI